MIGVGVNATYRHDELPTGLLNEAIEGMTPGIHAGLRLGRQDIEHLEGAFRNTFRANASISTHTISIDLEAYLRFLRVEFEAIDMRSDRNLLGGSFRPHGDRLADLDEERRFRLAIGVDGAAF